MKKAVGILKELSADEQTRMIAENREKARRDWMSRMDGARREGEQSRALDIARNLLKMGMDSASIVTATGLTSKEIESLRMK
jgi:predicted transposase/invertase (TIGR01784 family)